MNGIPLTDAELREVEWELKQAAHALPWRRGIGNETGRLYDAHGHMITTDCAASACTFLAKSPEYVRLLLAEVRRLRGKGWEREE